MAKRSPPIPFETGSIKPSVALAAIAASTALPPRFKMSIPTCVARGTLVQTIPCRARTSERVAKLLPVIRSICADERSTISRRTVAHQIAFISKRLTCPRNSDSRNHKRSASNQILHASPAFNSCSRDRYRSSDEPRCGRNAWSHAEEDFLDTNSDATSKKEDDGRGNEK